MKHLKSLVAAAGLATPAVSQAADLTISVTNLTRGIYFTPLLVAAHSSDASLFTAGTTASTSLQAMAEGGDIGGLAADLATLNAETLKARSRGKP